MSEPRPYTRAELKAAVGALPGRYRKPVFRFLRRPFDPNDHRSALTLGPMPGRPGVGGCRRSWSELLGLDAERVPGLREPVPACTN